MYLERSVDSQHFNEIMPDSWRRRLGSGGRYTGHALLSNTFTVSTPNGLYNRFFNSLNTSSNTDQNVLMMLAHIYPPSKCLETFIILMIRARTKA
jgi:hypothetical protein